MSSVVGKRAFCLNILPAQLYIRIGRKMNKPFGRGHALDVSSARQAALHSESRTGRIVEKSFYVLVVSNRLVLVIFSARSACRENRFARLEERRAAEHYLFRSSYSAELFWSSHCRAGAVFLPAEPA